MPAPKKLVLLGSTGSIGKSTLKVADSLPDEVEIIGLAGGSRTKELADQAIKLGAKNVCIYDQSKFLELKQLLPSDVHITTGTAGLNELASLAEADIVLISIVGTAGLEPTLAAIEAGKDIALASKEVLVMAGELVMRKAKEKGVTILPVDSEHNAIFQCLADGRPEPEIKKLILTASGGPFLNKTNEEISKATLTDALAHPTWSMGKKISIDSATLFNKGLEMIEARWLFDLPMEKIDVIVHPQSIIHSMVEYIDGSVIAQMNTTDMCFPIQYAITWPRRVNGRLESLDFAKLKQLNFAQPRFKDFPALNIAIEAGKAGGTKPAVMNAANEIAVEAFIQNQITFPKIWNIVEKTLESSTLTDPSTISNLISADTEAREIASKLIGV